MIRAIFSRQTSQNVEMYGFFFNFCRVHVCLIETLLSFLVRWRNSSPIFNSFLKTSQLSLPKILSLVNSINMSRSCPIFHFDLQQYKLGFLPKFVTVFCINGLLEESCERYTKCKKWCFSKESC